MYYGKITNCEHENVEKENKSFSSGQGPDDYDKFWTQVTCLDCNKTWEENISYCS